MTYYNPETAGTLSQSELEETLGTTIEEGTEEVSGWYLVHQGDKPDMASGTLVAEGEITEKDGVYVRTYTLTEKGLAAAKETMLAELESAYLVWRDDTATFVSSLGFSADADSRALQDITGLYNVAQLGASAEFSFMDADNVSHTLSADEVSTLAVEAAQATTAGYEQKWALREAINAAESEEELEAIDISFESEDYSS